MAILNILNIKDSDMIIIDFKIGLRIYNLYSERKNSEWFNRSKSLMLFETKKHFLEGEKYEV